MNARRSISKQVWPGPAERDIFTEWLEKHLQNRALWYTLKTCRVIGNTMPTNGHYTGLCLPRERRYS